METKVWQVNFGLKIPVNELPKRLDELPKDELIAVACPHSDRSNMARVYLVEQGFNPKFALADTSSALVIGSRGTEVKPRRTLRVRLCFPPTPLLPSTNASDVPSNAKFGFNVKYLGGGFLGLMERLKGGMTKDINL